MSVARRGRRALATAGLIVLALPGCGFDAELAPLHGRDYRVVTDPSGAVSVPVPQGWRVDPVRDPEAGFVGIVASENLRRWRRDAPGVAGLSVVVSGKQAAALGMTGVRRAVAYDRLMAWCCAEPRTGCLSYERRDFSRLRGQLFGVEDRGTGCKGFSNVSAEVVATNASNRVVILAEVTVPDEMQDVADYVLQSFRVDEPGPVSPAAGS